MPKQVGLIRKNVTATPLFLSKSLLSGFMPSTNFFSPNRHRPCHIFVFIVLRIFRFRKEVPVLYSLIMRGKKMSNNAALQLQYIRVLAYLKENG